MDDQVLGLLRFGLLGLLYLFFGRAMWAVWTEVRTAGSAPAMSTGTPVQPATTPSSPLRATTVTVRQPAQARRDLVWSSGSFVVGRGRDCDWSLPDDAFLSQRHLGLHRDGSGLWIEDLGSTNGTLVDGRPVTGRQPLYVGAVITAGAVVLEAR